MSRQWERALDQKLCGGVCDKVVPKGEPLLVIGIVGVHRKSYRCRSCADEPVDEAQLAAFDQGVVSRALVDTTKPNRCEHDFQGTDRCIKCGWKPDPGLMQRLHLPSRGEAQIDETDARMRQAGHDD